MQPAELDVIGNLSSADDLYVPASLIDEEHAWREARRSWRSRRDVVHRLGCRRRSAAPCPPREHRRCVGGALIAERSTGRACPAARDLFFCRCALRPDQSLGSCRRPFARASPARGVFLSSRARAWLVTCRLRAACPAQLPLKSAWRCERNSSQIHCARSISPHQPVAANSRPGRQCNRIPGSMQELGGV